MIAFLETINYDLSDSIIDLKVAPLYISLTTKFFMVISVPDHMRLYKDVLNSVILHNIEEDIINIARPFIDKIYFESL